VGKDRVGRIWRREGLKVPQQQKPRDQLWLNDGSCVRLRPEWPNHVCSYDFVSTFTHDGRTVRMLNLIDEYARGCLAIYVSRRINSNQVIEVLAAAMIEHGIPEYIRSENGPEFVAVELRKWLAQTGAMTLYIEPGSPWENGYCESFNSKLRDEFLNGEIFYSLKEVNVLAERWRVYYNTQRPHSSLGYRPPAPQTRRPENKQGYGKVESKERFPLSHTPAVTTTGSYLTLPLALPATFTIATALGARARAKLGVLPTRPTAVDEAATIDILCSDKTGTLTRNELSVTSVRPMPGFDEAHALGLATLASSDGGQDSVDTAIDGHSPGTRG
jgi:putative transposase